MRLKIESIQIGTVVTEGDTEDRDPLSRRWTSAFRKTPVQGAVHVQATGIAGDQVADTKNHGGPEKALLCYPGVHYLAWAQEHPELNWGPGGFGENLVIADGWTEADVCIGDRWIGEDCELEISQPRQPCWKISRRWSTKTLTKEVAQTGRTGWYCRVIREGELSAGKELDLGERPHPDWSVARVNDVLFGREVDRLAVHELMNLSRLSQQWKASLA
ncbi:MOSC domain-containing protein [Roseiconus nitratireducens]|uniref:MOSC domain-containing protein n=1 Tax=Roseiconus nitratireducens TaxID=2605748 RepID=A0A5M6CZ29_9BACT|nr:MOSC domain-containing protein [Roseiconus nitratireducens]KAA5540471.1 MOSC domain-containing protein [Roseiconus nitratireducens]